jgi:hypothetical protein
MKASRLVSLAASALLAFSTATASAGTARIPPHTSSGHGTATAVWVIFGCAGSIIFAAWVKNIRQHRELTQQEAMTCGILYWFTPQNYH